MLGSDSISFVVDGPPVPKGRPRFANGRAYTDKRTVDFEKKVRGAAKAALKLLGDWTTDDKTLNYKVTITVWRKANRGDLDNFVKVVLDSINNVLYHDDRQVSHIAASMYTDKRFPRVDVCVEVIDG